MRNRRSGPIRTRQPETIERDVKNGPFEGPVCLPARDRYTVQREHERINGIFLPGTFPYQQRESLTAEIISLRLNRHSSEFLRSRSNVRILE